MVESLDDRTATRATSILVERLEGLSLDFVDEITKMYHRVSQKDNVHMESDAVVLERDLRTGERVNIANVIISEDFTSMNEDNRGSTFVLDIINVINERKIVGGIGSKP